VLNLLQVKDKDNLLGAARAMSFVLQYSSYNSYIPLTCKVTLKEYNRSTLVIAEILEIPRVQRLDILSSSYLYSFLRTRPTRALTQYLTLLALRLYYLI
jgi:hypothetical protein